MDDQYNNVDQLNKLKGYQFEVRIDPNIHHVSDIEIDITPDTSRCISHQKDTVIALPSMYVQDRFGDLENQVLNNRKRRKLHCLYNNCKDIKFAFVFYTMFAFGVYLLYIAINNKYIMFDFNQTNTVYINNVNITRDITNNITQFISKDYSKDTLIKNVMDYIDTNGFNTLYIKNLSTTTLKSETHDCSNISAYTISTDVLSGNKFYSNALFGNSLNMCNVGHC